MICSEALIVYADAFKKIGLKKYGNTWFKKYEELTVVINIQTSYFDKNNYFVNVGVALNCEISGRYPKSRDWLGTLHFRVNTFKGDDNLGTTPEERQANIKKLPPEERVNLHNSFFQPEPSIVLENAIPFIEKLSTVENLFDFIRTDPQFVNLRREEVIEKISNRLKRKNAKTDIV